MEIACNRQWVNCIANLCPWRQALNFSHCLHRLLMVRGCGNHTYYSLRTVGEGAGGGGTGTILSRWQMTLKFSPMNGDKRRSIFLMAAILVRLPKVWVW